MKNILNILVLASSLSFADVCTGQTVLGKHPKDTVVAGFLGQNGNANRILNGLNTYSTVPLALPGGITLGGVTRTAWPESSVGNNPQFIGLRITDESPEAVPVWQLSGSGNSLFGLAQGEHVTISLDAAMGDVMANRFIGDGSGLSLTAAQIMAAVPGLVVEDYGGGVTQLRLTGIFDGVANAAPALIDPLGGDNAAWVDGYLGTLNIHYPMVVETTITAAAVSATDLAFAGSGITGVTNDTPPANTSLVRAWVNFTNATGGLFKMPLYQ